MMKLTSAVRITFALAATTIGISALAGPFDVCEEEYYDNVEPCVGPCAIDPPQCRVIHEWISACVAGGGGCYMGSYYWYYRSFDLYHCAPGPTGQPCVCGTGTVIESGYMPKWTRDCNL